MTTIGKNLNFENNQYDKSDKTSQVSKTSLNNPEKFPVKENTKETSDLKDHYDGINIPSVTGCIPAIKIPENSLTKSLAKDSQSKRDSVTKNPVIISNEELNSLRKISSELKTGKSHLESSMIELKSKNFNAILDNEDINQKLLLTFYASPVPDESIYQFNKSYSKNVHNLIKGAKTGKLALLNDYLIAMEMSKKSKWKEKIDVAKVNSKIEALSKDPVLLKVFENTKKETLKDTFGDPQKTGNSLAYYLTSESFVKKLTLLPPEKQKEIISNELGKLSLLAPELVPDVTKEIIMIQVYINAPADYLAADKKATIKSLEEIIRSTPEGEDFVKELSKTGKKVSKVTNAIDRALREMAMIPGVKDQDHLIAILHKAEKIDPEGASGAIKLITKLRKNGKLGAIDGLFASVSLITKGVPENKYDVLNSTSSLASFLSKGQDFAKFFGMTDEALKAGNFAKTLNAFKWLSPVSDGMSAGLDMYGAYKDFKEGDKVGTTAKSVSAVAGVTSAVAGASILLKTKVPTASLVVLGSTAINLLAFGVDCVWGKSQEEIMIKKLGVLKDKD